MKWMQDIVFFDGKEQKVRFLIKILKLSSTTYRNKRREGWSAQKAFEHCRALKKRKEYLKNVNVKKLSEEKNVSLQAIYKSLNNEKEPAEILASYEDLKKKREDFHSLLSSQDAISQYKSIYEFCIQEGLNVSSVYQNLASGMTFYEAVLNSFSMQLGNNVKNIYLGILVKSLAQKYRLDYEAIQFIFRKTHDYVLSFHKVLFHQVFADYSINKKKILWKIYMESFLNDCSVIPMDVINDHVLNLFFQVYWNFQSIQKDFNYYQFLTTISIPDYISLSIDERVACLLQKFATLPFSLEEMYFILDFEHGLMQDFVYHKLKNIWVYKGNREVLKKLKKPSD